MSITRVLGFVLLVGGVVLIIVGVTASRSFADSLSNWITGRFTQSTMWYLIGGVISAVAGLLLSFGAIGRTR
jgi:uncharacterized membrane protein HdeD (DUF308 family)